MKLAQFRLFGAAAPGNHQRVIRERSHHDRGKLNRPE
jgi:hypothetical protein